ncbi:hypothetical protein [Pseudoxanthomonas suwonensis]|uniref:Proline-rich protein n=1 Tax=Pseudoxanthomonas suwonensis TaxID=314722 RepID=A0A0E3Z0D3_9GAMM|nr:hypothetical protein [Pseudoxanthomonas suwonensis]AKC85979.1 hypothetical protein WQ53_03565 [Pseudoxanthomonas suwonensis]
MRDGIYRKTNAGRDEIRDRARRLAPPLRTVLLMVDGQRSLAQLREVMAGMRAPDDALEMLLAEGLIEAVPTGFDAAGLMDALAPRAPATPAAPAPVAASIPAAAPEPALAKRSAQYLYLYERMSDAVRAHLGLRGYFMQLKVERCADADSLQALLPELLDALAKAKGGSFASDWERTLQVPA